MYLWFQENKWVSQAGMPLNHPDTKDQIGNRAMYDLMLKFHVTLFYQFLPRYTDIREWPLRPGIQIGCMSGKGSHWNIYPIPGVGLAVFCYAAKKRLWSWLARPFWLCSTCTSRTCRPGVLPSRCENLFDPAWGHMRHPIEAFRAGLCAKANQTGRPLGRWVWHHSYHLLPGLDTECMRGL